MFAAPPPPDPPTIAAEQQGDFDCLRVATMLGKSSNNAGISPWAPRLLRIYLNRLQHADASRDWLATAASEPTMGYGWFLPNLQRCTAPLRGGRSTRPTQAAPPVTPQPTGG
jgi:hypothetical protein